MRRSFKPGPPGPLISSSPIPPMSSSISMVILFRRTARDRLTRIRHLNLAKNQLTLETGHSSPEEGLLILREGRKQGVRHMVVSITFVIL